MTTEPQDELTDSGWWPWWKKPMLMSDWEQLLSQRLRMAVMSTETYKWSKRDAMPKWFILTAARRRWYQVRHYLRLKRRVERMKSQLAERLYDAIMNEEE